MPPAKEPVSTEEVTSAPLQSAAFFIGEACAVQNAAFAACKSANSDPAACIDQGVAVTQCAVNLFKLLKEHCGTEYTAHWTCLDKQNQQYQYCRPEEAKLNTCVLAKLNLGEERVRKQTKDELVAWRKLR